MPKPIMALIVFGIVLTMYGGLGLLGLFLSNKIGFAKLWDTNVSNRQRFLIPLVWGVVAGLLIIVGDLIFSQFNPLGKFPHPPFPTSLVASFTAGVGEEILFRLFFIAFWVWLISNILLKKKFLAPVFWIVSTAAAIAFALGHLPAVMVLYNLKTPMELPVLFWAEIILLNSLVSFPAAYYFRKYGILAAMGIHFWADIVWHVIYGSLS
ncbi:MAG: CPBP family glutamic-type intramembrane protease [Patescibacteria group bacterium]|nr:CPBP family glutamic-type intramembrane protease [Patescibacteria group bacterium]